MGKHRRDDDASAEERKKGKKEKKEKHKKHKKHHHKEKKERREKRRRGSSDSGSSSSSEDEAAAQRERLVKEAKRFLKQKMKEGKGEEALAAAELLGRHKRLEEEPPYTGDIKPISRDEYFQRNPEFSLWLREARGRFFSQLDSEQSHALFGEFVEAWNGGRLPTKYYTGGAAGAAGAQRSGYSWAIKGGGGGGAGGAVGMAAALDDELDMKAAARERAQAERRQERTRHREAAEEWLGPKPAGGREAMLEKKAARREAARAREDSPDQVRLPGGGDVWGDDSFAAAKEREARRQEFRGRRQAARQGEVEARLAAARQAEDERMAQFRALLSAGPISIPKRQPPPE